jgi:hypothetical protein
VTLKKSAVVSKNPSRLLTRVVCVSLFGVLAVAGVLALCSCASTPKGIAREERLYLTTSNALTTASYIAPMLPGPAAPLAEGLLAVGGALLALWSTHLHRSVKQLENGKSKPAAQEKVPPDPAA